MNKKRSVLLIFFLGFASLVLLWAHENVRSLSPGMEVSGRLDADENSEIQYTLRLAVPRGIYRLVFTQASEGFPGVVFSSDSLDEDIDLSPSLLEDPAPLLTLPSGDYTLSITNELKRPSLKYTMEQEFVSAWTQEWEWEPNEDPNQEIQPGKPLKGQILGEDEDCFAFIVPSVHPPAYDFILKTGASAALLFKVGGDGKDEELCQIGAKTKEGYSIRGLALYEGRYVVSISLHPSVIMGQMNKGDYSQISFPKAAYSLESHANNMPFCRLISEDEAMISAMEFKQSGSLYGMEIKEKADPRRETELVLYDENQKHIERLSLKKSFLHLTYIEKKFPARFAEFEKVIVETMEGALQILMEGLKEDSQIKNACWDANRRFGLMSFQQAKAFSALWPQWGDVPQKWAGEILGGHSARILQKAVLEFGCILSAELVSSSGLLVASTGIPSKLWQGDLESWKRLVSYGKTEVSLFPEYNTHLKKWVMETAFLVRDNGKGIGALVVRTVVGD